MDQDENRFSDEEAAKSLNSKVQALKLLSGPFGPRKDEVYRATVEHILSQEMGAYGRYREKYKLNEGERDLLLVKARADSLNALIIAEHLMRELRFLKYLGILILGIVSALATKILL
jgi:hypothetical protein